MDRDGYGVREGQTSVDRLLEDCRTLSPAGIERVAHGWVAFAEGGEHHAAYVAAIGCHTDSSSKPCDTAFGMLKKTL